MAEQDISILQMRITALEMENTRLRDAQEDATASRDRHAAMLMAEVQHRIRNMLATVRAVVSRTVSADGSIEQFVAHVQGRLDTLSRVQGALIRTSGGGLDLEELVREEFVAQGGFGSDQVEVEGPPVTLQNQGSELIGLALHELAVNAVKFGALTTLEGHVAVRWRIEGEQEQSRLILTWDESETSTVPDGSHRGFGRELIEDGLPYQLSARTSFGFRPNGILCTIELPVGPGDNLAGVSMTAEAGS